MSWGAILLLMFSALLCMLVLMRRLKLPLLMEFGMAMTSLGFIAAADAIHSETACTQTALLIRWGLVGGGLFTMLLSVALKARKGQSAFRRLTDYVDFRPPPRS